MRGLFPRAIGELTDLARGLSDTRIVLDHCWRPDRPVGSYAHAASGDFPGLAGHMVRESPIAAMSGETRWPRDAATG